MAGNLPSRGTVVSPALAKTLRTLHRVLGVFIAPALLFFALSGGLQTLGLHEAHPGSAAPPRWIVRLGQLHKKQTLALPAPRRPGPIASAARLPAPRATAPRHTLPIKLFFLLVCGGLAVSTLTGLQMAYRRARSKRGVTVILVCGLVVPALLLVLQVL